MLTGTMSGSILKFRESRVLVILVAFLAFFVDKLLITVVVPIVPNVLKENYYNSVKHKPICNKTETNFSHFKDNDNQKVVVGGIEFNESTFMVSNVTDRNCSNKQSVAIFPNDEIEIGLLFASKAIVQVCTNPIIGSVINRIGYAVPMFFGLIVTTVSTLTFAYGETFVVLLVARSIQGIGSSCSSVGALSMVSDKVRNDQARGDAIGTALCGLALGFLIGPPFGGVMYELFGKSIPFIVIVCIALFNGVLQICVLYPFKIAEQQDGVSVFQLFKDPYIAIIAGCLVIQNFPLAISEPTIPKWMDKTMNSPVWQQGLIFLPSVTMYLTFCKLLGRYGQTLGRWKVAFVGMILTGLCIIPIPFSTSYWHIMICIAILGIASGAVDAALLPQLGYIVDIRHVSVYGTVFAIADMSLALGFCIGPAVSGFIVDSIGFDWLMWMFAILAIVYAPMMIFIRDPPPKSDEKKHILKETRDGSYTKNDDEK